MSGHIKLTYDLSADVRNIMGQYDAILEGYRAHCRTAGMTSYEPCGLVEELLRGVPQVMPKAA